MSLGNLNVRLPAALKDCSSTGGASPIFRKFFIAESPPNYSLNVFGPKNSPVCFVKGTHLSPT